MSVKTFKGGTHPPESKEATEGKAIEYFLEPKQVALPVNQHFGAPIQPLVKVGDTVKRGQKIADGSGGLTAPLHAPISGVVKKIEPRPQPNNLEGIAFIIEANGSGETDFMPPLDAFSCSREEAVKRIREAGIIGMGGAGFPTSVKLSPKKPIEFIIANGAECEPYLTIDEAVMKENGGDVVEGLAIVLRILEAKKGIIAVEENKKQLLPILEKFIAERAKGMDISVLILKTKYPQGGEKMLITAITGREVPSGGLPMDVGCVVQNVGTLKAVYEAFALGKPSIDRALTVTGGACRSPKNIVVPIGTLIEDLVPSLIDADLDSVRKIIFGGPMMGVAVPSIKVPVQKNTSGVLLLTKKEAESFEEGLCIRCGRCMRACSCRLSPMLLNAALAVKDLERADEIGVLDCIECGTCSYVCPAHIQLVQRFRVGKQLVRAMKQKEAAHAK